MLEAVLYFVLGFLSAGLLALMISPAIWNRAVVLTKRRIESSVPLTLNEIQADKDQLRAEFAMSTRRLEMSIEELRDKAANQVIEINRKREELDKLTAESKERVSTIQELDSKASEQRAKLEEREQQLFDLNERYQEVEEKLELRVHELEDLKFQLTNSQEKINGQKIELAARDATIDNLNDTISTLSVDQENIPDEFRKVKQQLSSTKTKLGKITKNCQELEQQAADNQLKYQEAVNRLEKRDRELAALREASGDDDAVNAELKRQLLDEKERIVELEAKLASQVLNTEALLNDASNENVQSALSSIRDKLDKTDEELQEVIDERDSLMQELSVLREEKGSDWEAERRDNAILRERINDMAAQITAMTAALEGDESPIEEILAANDKSKTKKTGSSKNPETLAERIRAIQEASVSRN